MDGVLINAMGAPAAGALVRPRDSAPLCGRSSLTDETWRANSEPGVPCEAFV